MLEAVEVDQKAALAFLATQRDLDPRAEVLRELTFKFINLLSSASLATDGGRGCGHRWRGQKAAHLDL